MIYEKNNRLMIWPLTIVSDRYGGVYSGAEYTAWNLEHENVPGAISDGDNECLDFWYYNKIVVGLGHTPSAAEKDLIDKIQKGKVTNKSNINEKSK